MAPRFLPALVNDPFGDPGLYVDFKFVKRAIMFDLGDISALSHKNLLRLTDVFVSHRHMDHFCGFDHLLRIRLQRPAPLRIYGTSGMIKAVGHKLAGFSWNLLQRDADPFYIDVFEFDGNLLKSARFSAASAFMQQDLETHSVTNGILLQEDNFLVRSAIMDHDIDCLAFSLEEEQSLNIWKNKLDDMGLKAGAWLTHFKQLVSQNAPEDTQVTVEWQDLDNPEKTLPLRTLQDTIIHTTTGLKIGYVVDTAYNEHNLGRLIPLVSNADILYSEACFLQRDAHQGEKRNHLTAHQAGIIARKAKVKRLITFHYSPRYHDESALLNQEAQKSFSES